MLRRLLVAALLVFAVPAFAQDAALSPKQAEAVKKLIRDFLVENPEAIVDALEAYQEKQRLAAEAEGKKAMAERKKDIYEDPASPVGGNPKGDVTLVEFFDYNCGYCKSAHDGVVKTIKDDGKVRLIYKEFPILGPASVVAARAALASVKQKKYSEYQDALMRLKGGLSEDAIFKTAQSVGLNVEQLKADMADKSIDEALAKTRDLARALGINGTPGFVIGEHIVPGAVPPATLKQWIADARAKPKKG
ncbi:MAG: thioredoxin domain-containing protein [Rhodospirillales bacterium]|nr:thioredoxin domain-containing protein [Rhodospirillales bacterium]